MRTDGHVFLRTDPGSCKLLATVVYLEVDDSTNSFCVQFGDGRVVGLCYDGLQQSGM